VKINHLNLTVTDVLAAANFLETYFGLRIQGGDSKFTMLYDDNGMVISLMRSHQVQYPRSFHIGFIQNTREEVNTIYQRLKVDGFDVHPPEQHHAWTFYVQASGGFTVEVLC